MTTTSGAPETPDRAEWLIPVLDAVLRRRCNLVIAVAGFDVVVVPPTAAGYIVPPSSHQLHEDAMRAARNVAARGRNAYPQEAERP